MKKYSYIIMMAAAMVALSMVSCESSNEEADENPVVVCPISESTRAVLDGSTDMAYPFFSQVISTAKEGENLMVSPLSLTEVLAMLANGAEGETQKQILSMMTAQAYGLESACNAVKTINDYLPQADKKSNVAIANSQWIDDGLSVKSTFISRNESILGSETFNQNLCTTKTMNDINSWCEAKTQGLIKKLLYNTLPETTKMVLINALYFKGEWKNKFLKEQTTKQLFTNYDGTETMVDMMKKTAKMLVTSDDEMTIAELPYGNESFCMDVILPSEGVSLDEMLKRMDKKRMDKVFQSMKMNEVSISMPRMKLEYRRILNDDLMSMGLTDAFDASKANFSGISDSPLCLSYVEQITSLTVDENGAEAAAITHVGGYTATPEISVKVVNLNRPFVFLIREKQTGAVMFIGRMMKF